MQKFKKPVSVILSILMIVSLFAAVPMTVNAAPPGGSGSGEIGTEIGGTGAVITPTTAEDFSSETKTIFVTDSQGWDGNEPMRVYYWKVETTGYDSQWNPITETTAGTEFNMTWLYDNTQNQSVYAAQIPDDANWVKFSAGSGSTQNTQNVYDGSWWYIDGNHVCQPCSGDVFDTCEQTGSLSAAFVNNTGADCYYVLDGRYYFVSPTDGKIYKYENTDELMVAQVGNNKYSNVNDAVKAAGENGTVQLVADIKSNVGIDGDYTTTLDLNGHNITNTTGSAITLNSAYPGGKTFTIKDTVGTGTVTSTRKYNGDACISDSSGRKVVIEGGNYVANAGTAGDGQALYVSSDDGWTINGGTFNGDIKVVSELDVTGGTINGDINATGPSWKVDPAEVTISGGTVNGSLNSENGSTYEVSGGTFDRPVPEDFCADGYIPTDDGNGNYGVKQGSYVAQVGTTKYETFAEAVAAANGVQPITVLVKITEPYTLAVDETVILQDTYTKVTLLAPEGVYTLHRAYDSAAKTYTYTVVEPTASLTVGDVTTYYDTVNAALSAAPKKPEKSTVTLMKTVSESGVALTGSSAKDITLDLNDKTLTLTRNYSAQCTISSASNLTVKNGTIVFDTTYNNSSGFVVKNNSASLTIEDDVVLTGKGTCSPIFVVNGTVTTEGTITAEDTYAIATNGSSSTGYTINVTGGTVSADNATAIYLPGKSGTANISGGTITGDTAIYIKSGTLNITGGTITGNGAKADYTYAGDGANATGDAIVVDSCGYPGGAPVVTISGNPTVASTNGKQIGDYSYGNNALGEVTATSNTMTLPTGLKWVETATEGVYEVAPDYVAQVNGSGYMTFAEAVAARTSTNDVIELIKAAGTYTMTDVDEAPIKVQKNSKSVTIKAPANVPKVVTSATADGVTTYTLSDATVKHTAKNGNVTYYTASDLSSLNSDGTYQLLTDITRTQRMAFGNWANDVTIDLNGHTLTSTASDCAVTLGRAGSAASPKTFALVDTSTNKGGKLVFTTAPSTNTEAILVSGKYNNVTIGEGVTVQGGAVALMGENQTLTVNGTINGGDDFAIVTNGSSTKNATITVNDGAVVTSNSTAMYLPGTGTTTINGGTITGDTAIYIKSGTLDVKGGTITGNGAKADYTYNGSGANATGDAIVVDSCGYPGGAPTVTISGNPTVTSTNGKQIGDYSYGDNALGEVTATSNTMTLPTGLKWVETATEGVYEVAPDYVAEVNGTGYMTFAEAVAARTSKDDVISLFKAAGTYTMASADEAPIKVQKNSKSVTIKAPANVPKVVTSATADGVTTYTLSDATVKHTAKNGNVTYYTASDLSSLNSDGTYQLLTDITRTQRMAFGNWANDVTIDLNGHTLTSTASDCAVTLGRAGSAASPKTFALVDTSENKGGKLVFSTAPSTNTEAILVSGKYNNVTIGEGATVEGGAVALLGENQTLTVNGTIKGGDDFAIVTNGSSTKNATITVNDGAVVTSNSTAMYLPGTGTTTINGGTITGDTAIYIKSGTLDVKGGTITGNGDAADYTYNGSGANATGDAIVVDSCGYPGGAPTVTISGNPTVTSTNGKQIGDYSYGDNALGEVTATSNTMTLPTGLKWVETDTPGVYEVGQKLFVGHNLLLGGDIGVNFYLNPAVLDTYNGTKTVKFTCDGEETTVKGPFTETDYGYKVTLDVVAARMAHKINAVVYVDGTPLAETDSYSVQDYAEAVYKNPETYTTSAKAPALKALAKAMLNYGSEAQTVFATSLTEHPDRADKTVGQTSYTNVNAAAVKAKINGTASNLETVAEQLNAKYYTNSLIYLQNNTLRVYFTPKTYPSTMPNAGEYDGNLSNYYYYTDVAGIAAAELDEQKVFKVGDVTFKYSALNYVVNVLESGDKMNDAQKDLAASLFLYNQAANAYF